MKFLTVLFFLASFQMVQAAPTTTQSTTQPTTQPLVEPQFVACDQSTKDVLNNFRFKPLKSALAAIKLKTFTNSSCTTFADEAFGASNFDKIIVLEYKARVGAPDAPKAFSEVRIRYHDLISGHKSSSRLDSFSFTNAVQKEISNWGGTGITLSSDGTSARIQFDCGSAAIPNGWILKYAHVYEADGMCSRGGGPVIIGHETKPQPCHFRAEISGDKMELTESIATSTVAYSLVENAQPNMRYCE